MRDEIPEPLPGLAPPGSLVVEEQHFAVVPEWVIDADLSDAAFRLYSLLLRYGNGSGSRMPSRRLLAQRLHRSVDSVDRAMRELVDAGVVRVEHRRRGRLNLTNSLPPAHHRPQNCGGGWPQYCGHLRRPRHCCRGAGEWPHRCGYPHGCGQPG